MISYLLTTRHWSRKPGNDWSRALGDHSFGHELADLSRKINETFKASPRLSYCRSFAKASQKKISWAREILVLHG